MPTHAVQREPMKSARKAKSFRLVSDGFVPRSRTITRTILGSGTGPNIRCALSDGWQSAVVVPSRVGNGSLVELVVCIRSRYDFTRPDGFSHHQNQSDRPDDFARVLAHFCKPRSVSPSDCLPDVPQQLFDSVGVAGECPCSVRVFEARQRAS